MIRRPNKMKVNQALEVLRRQGRRGDTELAHVNRREQAILKALGGSGTRNPKTGMKEYFDGDGGDFGGQFGGYGEGAGMGAAPSPTTPGGSEQSLGEQVGDVLGFNNPRTYDQPITAFPGMAMGIVPGIAAQGAYGLASALGGLLRGTPMEGKDVSTAEEFGFPGPGYSTYRGGPEGRAETMGSALAAAPAQPTYLRGSMTTPPTEISSFIGPGMSDIQQRALIGTYGTQGPGGAFTSEAARRYYANLLSRGLVTDQGRLTNEPYVLPIERQYAQQVLGTPFPETQDASQYYNVIRGYL